MRVTTFGMYSQYLNDLSNTVQKYQSLEQEMSTGRKINQPSDNPVGFETDILTQSALMQVGQWQNNVTSGTSNLQMADSALSTLQATLGNIRSNVVEALNGSNTVSDLQKIIPSIQNDIGAVVQIANTNDGERYIFAGSNSTVKPLTGDTTAGFTWSGNSTAHNATVGQGVSIADNVDGVEVFNTALSGGTPSLMDTLKNIANDLQTASQSSSMTAAQPSITALQTDLSQLDQNIDNVSAVRADVGGRLTRFQSLATQLAQTSTTLTTQKGSAEDANLAQVVSQLTTQQTVYQAALMSGQRMVLPTLASVLN